MIKFLCGQLFFDPAENPSGERDGAPGQYYTDINVHNPNDRTIKFSKKIALVGFDPQQHGLQTSPTPVTLQDDEALYINCTDIVRLLIGSGLNIGGQLIGDPYTTPMLLEGYVVLYSRYKLDVAGIYTTCAVGCINPDTPPGSADLISSIQVDQLIPPSPVPAPAVGIERLSVSSAGVDLSVKPFSRFAYDGARLQIFDTNGRPLYDGGFTSGTRLTWRPLATDGRPLANGVYFYRVTVRDVLGQRSSKIGMFALMR